MYAMYAAMQQRAIHNVRDQLTLRSGCAAPSGARIFTHTAHVTGVIPATARTACGLRADPPRCDLSGAPWCSTQRCRLYRTMGRLVYMGRQMRADFTIPISTGIETGKLEQFG